MKVCRAGFNLVELLVVIVIIGIIIALLLPAVQAARESARTMQCKNNLKQIGLALHNYHSSYRQFPPLTTHGVAPLPTTAFQPGWFSWNVRILPYIEQSPLYEQLDVGGDAVEPFLYGRNKKLVSAKLSTLQCPSDPFAEKNWAADWGLAPEPLEAAHGSYLGVRGSIRNVPGNGAFPAANKSTRFSDFTDGTSNTLLVGERPLDEIGEWGWWALGTGFDFHGLADHVLDTSDGLTKGVAGSSDDLLHYWSFHKGGVNFVRVDGSVVMLPYTINESTTFALSTRSNGEVISEDF